jgi:hypothetical protein
MGFFNAFKNIVVGKPLFEVPPPNAPGEPQAATTPGGPKVIPAAYIEQVQCRQNGQEMECEATIQNHAQKELVLDKVEIFGKTLYLNSQRLSPGEEHEINLFDGPRPNNTANSQVNLYYKDESGDYFCSIHNIEFVQQPDSTYAINYIKFQNLRDV